MNALHTSRHLLRFGTFVLFYLVTAMSFRAQLSFEFPMTIDGAGPVKGIRLATTPDGDVIVEESQSGVGRGVVLDSNLSVRSNILKLPVCFTSHDTFICPDDGSITGTNHLLQKFTAAGRDESFNSPPYQIFTTIKGSDADNVSDIQVQPDGDVLYSLRGTIYRLFPDGSRDLAFPAIYGSRILLLPDGKFLSNGSSGVRRFTADGAHDLSFSDVLGFTPLDLALTPNGKILVAGNFLQVKGFFMPQIARLLPDGSVDTTFAPYTGLLRIFKRILVQTDGRIVCATGKEIIRLNADGTVDNSLHVILGTLILQDICLDTNGHLWYTTIQDPVTRLSARNRIVAQPGNVPLLIERSASIDSGWSLLQSVPVGARADFINDSYPGTGSSFFRIRQAN